MLTFLGKQWLGQREESHSVVESSATVKHELTAAEAKKKRRELENYLDDLAIKTRKQMSLEKKLHKRLGASSGTKCDDSSTKCDEIEGGDSVH